MHIFALALAGFRSRVNVNINWKIKYRKPRTGSIHWS